jgi:hypothetical protein
VAAAAELDDSRALLVALKRRIASVIDSASPRDLASLLRRLVSIDAELSALDAAAIPYRDDERAASSWSDDEL